MPRQLPQSEPKTDFRFMRAELAHLPSGARTTRTCSEFGGFVHWCGNPPGKLGARSDAKLAVDVGKVRLDRAHAHEQLAAISLFIRPCAASSATRRSVSVISSEAGARPLIRRSSARAFSAHSRAPSSSKTASDSWSASRAARFCCACRRTAPRQSSVRPCSSGYGCRTSSLNDVSNASIARSTCPSAASNRPRHREAAAIAQGLPSRPAFAS